MSNYFKICGDGYGRAIDCFPFTTEAERIAAFAAATMTMELIPMPMGRRIRMAIWKRSPHHIDLRVVGESPVDTIHSLPVDSGDE
jgi:hypothetical protein